MKQLFIETKYTGKIELSLKDIEQLPKNVGLCSSVQFIDSLKDIKKQLEQKNIEVTLIKGHHSKHIGQILGCDVLSNHTLPDVDAFLYIGDGLFHPKSIMLKTDKVVFSYNPFTKVFLQISKKDVELMQKKRNAAIGKFHDSKTIGILISTKKGQNNETLSDKLEKKCPDKKFYRFIADTIDFNQLENFPFIESWVNTACPRIAYDDMTEHRKAIISIYDLI